MKTIFWLTINNNGTAIARKTQPYSLKWNEIGVKINLELPDKLFSRPQIEASMKVPEEAVIPNIITAEVSDNIIASVKAATGLDLRITVESPVEEKYEEVKE